MEKLFFLKKKKKFRNIMDGKGQFFEILSHRSELTIDYLPWDQKHIVIGKRTLGFLIN
jgi:hypothetical protein